jgi:hypothetical protein
MARAAASLHRLAEEECNGPPWKDGSDAVLGRMYRRDGATEAFKAEQERHSAWLAKWECELDRKQTLLLARLDNLARDLPEPDDGKWVLVTQGDPRGRIAYLVAPDAREITIG